MGVLPSHKKIINQEMAKDIAKKRTNLKEGYLVRYADDFKILCRDGKTAQKWYQRSKIVSQRTIKTRHFTGEIANCKLA